MRRIARIAVVAVAGLAGLLGIYLIVSMIRYSPEYVVRVLTWRESSVATYRELFPTRTVAAPADPFHFAEDPAAAEAVAQTLAEILAVPDLDAFMTDSGTEALVVICDDTVLLERYYNGAQRDTLQTSFSVAKSFTSALIGAAVAEGHIDSIDDPITHYLPELALRDERFAAITIRHLLLMASGLDYEEMRPDLFSSDDILTTYYPDQREAAIEFTRVAGPPGEQFSYNKYHPQLLGLILERTTGMPVAQYLEQTIWQPIGMEYDGSWSLDSESSGFEKMETGVNATAIDFAKFGRLYLENGNWNGTQVLPAEWVAESTQVDPATRTAAYYADEFGRFLREDLDGYYRYMWYGLLREDGAADVMAEGDRGQFIYVSPAARMIIVRNGQEWGIAASEWINAFRALSVADASCPPPALNQDE